MYRQKDCTDGKSAMELEDVGEEIIFICRSEHLASLCAAIRTP